jgi:hypothetical protein
MAFGAGVDIGEEFAEGLREVSELQSTDRDAMRDLVDVGLIDVGSVELFIEMVDPEGHDRESVDGAAGCFGIESSIGDEFNMASLEIRSDPIVDSFDPIVALLVVFIDGPFNARNV